MLKEKSKPDLWLPEPLPLIISFERHGRVHFINEELAAFLGYDRAELLGASLRRVLRLVKHLDFRFVIRRLQLGLPTVQLPVIILRQQGDHAAVELSVYPIEGVALVGAFAVLQGPPEWDWPAAAAAHPAARRSPGVDSRQRVVIPLPGANHPAPGRPAGSPRRSQPGQEKRRQPSRATACLSAAESVSKAALPLPLSLVNAPTAPGTP